MIHHSSAACSVPRGSAGVHAATSQAACRIPHALTAPRSARLLHEQTSTRTSALHLHGCHIRGGFSPAAPAVSRLPAGRSTVVTQPPPPRTGRSLRRRCAAVIAAGGADVAAAAAAAAKLFRYAPTIAAAVNKEPVRVERETPTALSASVRRADVDGERATGTRAAG